MTAATPIAIPSIERKDRRRWARRAPVARWSSSRTGSPPREGGHGVEPGRAPRGQDAEDGTHRHREGERREHRPRRRRRGKRGVEEDEAPHGEPAHGEAEEAARGRDEHRLGEEREEDLLPPRAEG